ncbi:MAG TPA: hypothetical protein VGP93_09520, partial [Polyangiaceae bacterium]|nr:hypothetical protein [Polyangiaceae bacterium]
MKAAWIPGLTLSVFAMACGQSRDGGGASGGAGAPSGGQAGSLGSGGAAGSMAGAGAGGGSSGANQAGGGGTGGSVDYLGSLPSPVPSFLRGINLGDRLDAPKEGDWGPVLHETDFGFVAAAGFDHIRLPVRFNAHAAASAPFTLD